MAKVTKTEEWQEAIKKHIDKLTTDQERYDFAHAVIFDTALWTGYNGYEMIGLVECVKMELLEALRNNPDCDCEDCRRARGEDDDD